MLPLRGFLNRKLKYPKVIKLVNSWLAALIVILPMTLLSRWINNVTWAFILGMIAEMIYIVLINDAFILNFS